MVESDLDRQLSSRCSSGTWGYMYENQAIFCRRGTWAIRKHDVLLPSYSYFDQLYRFLRPVEAIAPDFFFFHIGSFFAWLLIALASSPLLPHLIIFFSTPGCGGVVAPFNPCS